MSEPVAEPTQPPSPADPPSIRSVLSTPAFAVMVILTAIIGAMIGILAFSELPPANKDMFNTVLGVVTASFGAAVAYFIGSSAGSKSKDDVINSIAKGPTP